MTVLLEKELERESRAESEQHLEPIISGFLVIALVLLLINIPFLIE